MQAFSQVLAEHDLDTSTPASGLPGDGIAWFANALKAYAPATERLCLSAVIGFYEYLSAEGLAAPTCPACGSCSRGAPAALLVIIWLAYRLVLC